MSLDRQEKALREYKQILQDLVHLLRTSTKVQLSYLCWVNRARQQFVWETNSTGLPNVMFQDRVAFENHFLNEFKDTDEIIQLMVGEDIEKAKLIHYFDFVQAKNILIVPFINKGETVALTVLESEQEIDQEAIQDRIMAYNNALVNVLDTYLEVVDLHEQQQEWEDYEESLNKLDYRGHKVEIFATMMEEMQKNLPNGGAVLLAPGMESWNVILRTQNSKNPPKLGLQLEEKSVAYEALEKGEPIFTMHFNNNPRRITSAEKRTEGATFAIPVMIHDRRQGVVVCYDNDPLTFKESTKHKLSNMVRIAALSVQSSVKKSGIVQEILTQNFGAFTPELWEIALNNELAKLKKGSPENTWLGLVAPDDVSALRTKFRLEDLQKIQTDFVTNLNPSKYGIPGFVGYNSDYVYAVLIQSDDEEAVSFWMEKMKSKLEAGLNLSIGGTMRPQFKVGYTKLTDQSVNAYQVMEKAKKALAKVMNDKEAELVEA
ncbi:MAG: GAF domain-containing protein [Gracilimonas sp.]|uniref:GAF domain-containing protein n=1 Tax=Gracilimonas TaxID=649462 RepID=UPI001B034459|nr:GAF domain-containing protein [Gracilimonas sp.]MBO6587099.1 GAF domain-containing protein [Gracilimonas sp.]MBO6614413.1 GAF domain-containing protein [Gracilimonas sp.]